MGDFGKAVGYTLGGTVLDRPPKTLTTDPRTGYQRAAEARNVALMDELNRAYSTALADPMYGLPDVPQQLSMEQDVVDSIYNRLGAAGSLGAGTSRAAASKGIADYRLGLLREQAAQRQKLRGDLLAATQGYPGTPFAVAQIPGEESMMKSLTKSVGGAAAKTATGRAMGGI